MKPPLPRPASETRWSRLTAASKNPRNFLFDLIGVLDLVATRMTDLENRLSSEQARELALARIPLEATTDSLKWFARRAKKPPSARVTSSAASKAKPPTP
jgi:hypothetical protein